MNVLKHCFDDNKAGALYLAALGAGLFFLPAATTLALRYILAATILLIACFRSRHCRRRALRIGIPVAAAVAAIALCLVRTSTGAIITLAGCFLWIFVSVFPVMLQIRNHLERAACGAAAIAALLLSVYSLGQISRLNFIECRMIFSVAAFAGALTLALRPGQRGEK